MRVTPAKIPMPIWKNDCNRGKMKFNAAAAQCCIYAVKDKRIREMRNGMNTIEKNINVIEISDISAPELDVFARMTETQLRSKLEPEKGIFIAESPTVIRIALDAGYEPLSLLVEKKHVLGQAADIIERTAGIPVYTAETQLFQSLPVIRSHGVCSAQCEGSRPFRLKAFAAVQAALPFWTELLIQQISEQSFAPPPRSAWMRCCSPPPAAIRFAGVQ